MTEIIVSKEIYHDYLNKNPIKRSHKKFVKEEKVYKIFLQNFRGKTN